MAGIASTFVFICPQIKYVLTFLFFLVSLWCLLETLTVSATTGIATVTDGEVETTATAGMFNVVVQKSL